MAIRRAARREMPLAYHDITPPTRPPITHKSLVCIYALKRRLHRQVIVTRYADGGISTCKKTFGVRGRQARYRRNSDGRDWSAKRVSHDTTTLIRRATRGARRAPPRQLPSRATFRLIAAHARTPPRQQCPSPFHAKVRGRWALFLGASMAAVDAISRPVDAEKYAIYFCLLLPAPPLYTIGAT